VAGYHIVTGSYGSNVELDGLNMALIASWPGPIHEGHGNASFYMLPQYCLPGLFLDEDEAAVSGIITNICGQHM
jgi:hypothetical protein